MRIEYPHVGQTLLIFKAADSIVHRHRSIEVLPKSTGDGRFFLLIRLSLRQLLTTAPDAV